VAISFSELLFGKQHLQKSSKASKTCPNVFIAYQLAKNDYSITENKHRLTKTHPQSMRASNSLELAETSMVKNLQKKSSNGLDNSANGFSTSKNPWLVFYGTSISQKMKKLGLLHFPPSTLLELVRQNAPFYHEPSTHAHLNAKTWHRVQPCQWCKLYNG
jgi:hypothetical protein